MTELANSAENTSQSQSGTSQPQLVQMSQGALDGLLGSAKREAAERERQKNLSEIEHIKEEARAEARVEARAEAERQVQQMEKRRLEEQQNQQKQAQQKQLDDAQKAIKDKLVPKFEEGRKKYGDWQDTVLSYDWQKAEYAEILPLLAQDEIDNPDDVLHHLCEGAHIEKLTSKNKAHVMAKLKEISQSLKSSREKSVVENPIEPIKPLKPSHVKSKGDGDYTIEDFRKASWLRT